MKRKQITQIINTSWCPKFIKKLVAEFLSWFVVKVNATKPFIPLIESMVNDAHSNQIINIDFNIGAGIESVKPYLKEDIQIKSIPISDFNTDTKGVYLFLNSFHQLNVKQAKEILSQIVNSKNPIIIVEGNNDSLWQVVGMTVFVPLTTLLTAPFVKPFRLTRLLFTYIIPVLPLIITIDGCIALLKLYNPKDLLELTSSINAPKYEWKAGKNDNGRGGKIIYLTGKPI